MKYTPIIFTLLSMLIASASSLRDWTLNDGRFFPATYTEMDGTTVVLTSESGKVARFPVENISVADRYYLHKDQDIPIEQLEGGNIFTAEKDVKIKAKSFEKISGIKMKGEGYDLSFDGILTPNYLILHEKGAKPGLYAEVLEKVHFSHAYRHPNYTDLINGKRQTFLFMKDFKLYKELGKAFIDQLRVEGKHTNKHINQVEANWSQYPGHNPWHLPKEYMDKYNAEERVDIEFSDKKKSNRKLDIIQFYNIRWYWYWPHRKHIHDRVPGDSTMIIKDPTVNSAAFSYLFGLTSNNDIRAHGEHNHGAGGGLDQSNKHVTGRFGPSKKWSAELSKKVKSGSLQVDASFSTFYNAPSNDGKVTTPEKYRDYGLLCVGAGRFFGHDLKHMFGVCKMTEYMHANNKLPDLEEMPEMFGYTSVDELDAAFQDFLIKGNARMKP